MLIEFNCLCGNNNPSHVKRYDGALGYESFICTDCGRYSDHLSSEIHPADDFSLRQIGKSLLDVNKLDEYCTNWKIFKG